MKASSPGAASSGLAAFSLPMVVVRSAPAHAEQNEPAPWVGYTASSSGRFRIRSCSERHSARASCWVRSGAMSSVRATAHTRSDPPENAEACGPAESQAVSSATARSGSAGGGLERGCGEPPVVLPHDLAGGGGEHEPWLVLDTVSVGEPAGGVEGDWVAQVAQTLEVGVCGAGGWLGGHLIDGDELLQRAVSCYSCVPAEGGELGAQAGGLRQPGGEEQDQVGAAGAEGDGAGRNRVQRRPRGGGKPADVGQGALAGQLRVTGQQARGLLGEDPRGQAAPVHGSHPAIAAHGFRNYRVHVLTSP